MPKNNPSKQKISKLLEDLEKIVDWFDNQEEVDVELGLEKVKQGSVLIKNLKAQLKTVDNQFQEIQKDLLEN